MLKRFSNGQLEKLLHHTVGTNSILTELLLSQQDENPFEADTIADENFDLFIAETKRTPADYIESDRLCREQAMNVLCGRWSSANRRFIEISRAGSHFILTFLKRNGSATDERHVLVWMDGDILFYGYEDRISVLAYNKENDVLMLSPGMDYIRMPEEAKK